MTGSMPFCGSTAAAAEAAFDMKGAFNDAVVSLAPGD